MFPAICHHSYHHHLIPTFQLHFIPVFCISVTFSRSSLPTLTPLLHLPFPLLLLSAQSFISVSTCVSASSFSPHLYLRASPSRYPLSRYTFPSSSLSTNNHLSPSSSSILLPFLHFISLCHLSLLFTITFITSPPPQCTVLTSFTSHLCLSPRLIPSISASLPCCASFSSLLLRPEGAVNMVKREKGSAVNIQHAYFLISCLFLERTQITSTV